MVYDRSISDSVFYRLISDSISACIIVSKSIVDGLIDKHREHVFPKMKAESLHDKQTSTEKHPMACTRKSLRFDRAT